MSPTGSARRPVHHARRAARLVPWLLGGLVVAVGLVAAAVAVGRATGGGEPPLTVVQRYLDAYPDRDCEELMGLVTREWWTNDGLLTSDEALSRCRSTEGQTELEAAFEALRVVSERADRAVVEIRVTHVDGQVVSDEVLLRRQGGAWRVDPLG